jgi:hypothetical protein
VNPMVKVFLNAVLYFVHFVPPAIFIWKRSCLGSIAGVAWIWTVLVLHSVWFKHTELYQQVYGSNAEVGLLNKDTEHAVYFGWYVGIVDCLVLLLIRVLLRNLWKWFARE